MNEVGHTLGWIAHELLADAQITSKVHEKDVYVDVADEGAGDIFIVYSFVSDAGTLKLGQRRKKVETLWDIRGYAKSGKTADLKLVADRIDELFAHFANRQFQGWNFSSQFENLLHSTDRNETAADRRKGLGGTYRILAYQASGGLG